MKDKFLFGVATSAHQIEGDNINNDWWKYEGQMTGGISSGKATNSWIMFEEDIKAIKDLGCNAYRFSIEWSRIEPQEGKFDKEALNWYIHFIDRLIEEGIEPIVTIHHLTNPLWLEEKGAWQNKEISEYFRGYCEFIAPYIAPRVRYIITINEPNVFLAAKYLLGIWNPFKEVKNIAGGIFDFKSIVNNIVKSHEVIYEVFKKYNPEIKISLCPQVIRLKTKKTRSYFFTIRLKRIVNNLTNYYIYDQVKNKMDYIAVNFYTRGFIWVSKKVPFIEMFPDPKGGDHIKDFIQKPKDLYKIINNLYKRYELPIMISENGVSTNNDFKRIVYLKGVFKILKRIKEKNIPLIGYMHWTLMDNFEWQFAYKEKFGLYAVDPQTFKRIPKESAKEYAKLIKEFKHL